MARSSKGTTSAPTPRATSISATTTPVSSSSTRTLQVTLNGDTTVEPDETFFLNLLSATNATLAENQGVATILNDDGLTPAPDLSVTKTGPATVALGQTFTYTITIANTGGDATGVVMTDVLPVEVTFVSATPSQGNCTGTTTVTCNLGTLAAGNTATVTIDVVAPSTPSSFSDAVPTLSEWASIALLLALAAFAVTRLR